MDKVQITRTDRHIFGEITLDGSKSISNRALIIRALSGQKMPIERLSSAKDTQILIDLLSKEHEIYDAGHAGTAFRFLTAYFALQPDTQILTGSDRLKQRPIGALVAALNRLGADISFLETDGFAPICIKPPKNLGKTKRVSVPSNISSQFISSLLMIGPCLPNGLEIELVGEVVSKSYILMTIEQMRVFGAQINWTGSLISIEPTGYQPRSFSVESDWSSASYFYAIAALSDAISLKINGLYEKSWQGDSILPFLFEPLGVKTTFGAGHILLEKTGISPHPFLEKDFIDCPDIAQTVAVVCGILGVRGIFTGLDTLSIKETDRIAALKSELKKVGVSFSKLPPHFHKKQPDKKFYLVEGKAVFSEEMPFFETFDDHRMAMSFAPIGLISPVEIENPSAVEKSYPNFWEDLMRLRFTVQMM